MVYVVPATPDRATGTIRRALTLAETRAYTHCELCPLGCGQVLPENAVRGIGSDRARLIVVGEAPGATEINRGEPFVGLSGKLLWKVLAKLGVWQEDVYKTNALLCLPPKGPSARALRACEERLAAELAAQKDRRVILVLGSHAAHVLRGDKVSITSLNGKVEWSEEWGCWIVYAYHPAAILRREDMYDDFAWAVGHAVRMLYDDAQPPELPSIDLHVAQRMDTPLLWSAGRSDVIVCDLETTGLNPRTDQILAIGLRWASMPPVIINREVFMLPHWLEALQQLLSLPGITWVGHNYKFDVEFLRHQLGLPARIGADTMLMHHALDERSGGEGGGYHDLKTLGRRYLDWPDWSENIDGAHMADVPEGERNVYQAYDLEATWSLYFQLHSLLEHEPASREDFLTPLQSQEKVVIPAANAIADIELRGVRIDRKRLDELDVEYERLGQEADERVRVLANDPTLNPRSPTRVAKLLYGMTEDMYDTLLYPNLRKTDKATLHELQRIDTRSNREPNTLLDAILEARSVRHTRSLYIHGLRKRLDALDRVHTNLLLHGATTGRLASRFPNLQNIPADSVIKQLFIPSDGMVMCNADYKQLEVRVLAWYSRDPALFAAFLAKDFHWEVCKVAFPSIVRDLEAAQGNIYALDRVAESTNMFDEFARRQRGFNRTHNPSELYSWLKTRLRRKAKYVTFGNIYGEGAQAISGEEKGLGVTVWEAEQFQANWRRQYPVASRWLDQQGRLATSAGWVESATGRRRRFANRHLGLQNRATTEGRNHPVQAFASDVNLIALTKLHPLLRDNGLGRVLLPVHDSLLFELVEETLEESTALIRETMTTVVSDPDVLFDVDIATGANWAACH